MRVAQTEICNSLFSDLGKHNEDLAKYSSQLSSGKILNHLRDSPSGSAKLVALAKIDADIDQYISNTDTGNMYLGVAESVLNEVNNLVASIYSKGSQAASEILGEDSRSALAYEIRSLRDQIVSLANTEVRGRHIFAGSMVAEAPFLLEGDAITYRGDGIVNTLSVDSGTEVQMNYAGDTMFNPVFAAIDGLLAALDANDVGEIQSVLSGISPALSDLSKVRAQIGSNMSLLESVETRLESRETAVREQRSRIEDADMAQSAVLLKQTQTALDAAVSAAGAVLTQRNLFDILG